MMNLDTVRENFARNEDFMTGILHNLDIMSDDREHDEIIAVEDEVCTAFGKIQDAIDYIEATFNKYAKE